MPPGTYTVSALSSGQKVASVTLTVVAAGQTLKPVLQMIDSITGLAYTGAGPVIVTAGQSLTVRCEDFQPGTIDFYIDTTGGAKLPSKSVPGGNGSPPQYDLTWPPGVTGQHNVLVYQKDTIQVLEATSRRSSWGGDPIGIGMSHGRGKGSEPEKAPSAVEPDRLN